MRGTRGRYYRLGKLRTGELFEPDIQFLNRSLAISEGRVELAFVQAEDVERASSVCFLVGVLAF
ncbi:MAG TPA: hypothetical protein VGJ20_41620 [Xanthobacteraceae bacterium]|jgi:hypothetical protein